MAPALPSPRNVATSQSAVKGKDQPRKRNSKSVEFALDMSQGQQQRSKAVASMDYSMCLSPAVPDVGVALAGRGIDYRRVWPAIVQPFFAASKWHCGDCS